MKKYRKVSIRNSHLRAARKFLREVIIIETWWAYRELQRWIPDISKTRVEQLKNGEIDDDLLTPHDRRYLKITDEQERLRDSLRRSIVECFD